MGEMNDDIKKVSDAAEQASEELDLDALDDVAGGASLRNVKKIDTTDISTSTTNRI
ncbi:MAG: hypothetical protein IK078_03825 [Lachnospiraceae bacterium]|nr:hypothetical protein [Lachnospiraceae bacterium]